MAGSHQMQQPVLRLFASHEQARDAIKALEAAGVGADAISVLAPSLREARALHQETGADDDLQAAAQPHPLRDLLDWLGRVEAVAVPGFASVLATGDVGLHMARGNPAPGAMRAALGEVGVPVDEATQLEEQVLHGRILVVIHGTPVEQEAARSALGIAGG